MKAPSLLGVTLCGILLAASARAATAQSEVGAQLDLFSAYVWRGITYTNKPVAQPDVWLSFPAGNAAITVGGWANVELGKYADPEDDFSESGGLSAFNLAELNPYAEVSFSSGRAAIAGGIVGSTLGAKRFDSLMLRRVLALVLLFAGVKLIFI